MVSGYYYVSIGGFMNFLKSVLCTHDYKYLYQETNYANFTRYKFICTKCRKIKSVVFDNIILDIEKSEKELIKRKVRGEDISSIQNSELFRKQGKAVTVVRDNYLSKFGIDIFQIK